MAVTGSYSLKWHGHSGHLNSSIAKLYCCNAYTDVVLATTDGNYVSAHQFVLSACSPYLHNIFTVGSTSTKSNAKIVVVLPPEIGLATLSVLLQYIYSGEAIVNQDQLPGIMKAAELLQISGLYKAKHELEKNTSSFVKPASSIGSDDRSCDSVKSNHRASVIYNSEQSESTSVNAGSSSPNSISTNVNRKSPPSPIRKKHKSNINETKNASHRGINEELFIEKMIVGEEIFIKDEPIEWEEQKMLDNINVKEEVRSDNEEAEDGFVPLTCDVCQHTFPTPALWVRHIETVHPNTALGSTKRRNMDSGEGDESATFPPLRCDHCQEVFHVPAEWVKHIKTHEEDQLAAESTSETANSNRRIECTICKKLFQSYASMQVHIRSHTGERPFICKLCGREFSVKSNYARHLRTLHDQVD